MCLFAPKTVQAYQTPELDLIVFDTAALGNLMDQYGSLPRIPGDVMLSGHRLKLEYDSLNPVYELGELCKVNNLNLLVPKMVRCSNCY